MEMELRATQRLRRSGQAAKTTAKKADSADAPAKAPSAPPKKADSADAPAKAPPAPPKAPADRLSVSRQALTWLERQAELDREREMRRQERRSDSLSALESKKQALDGLGKKLKVQGKCQKIAAAIMRGDRVPPEDLKYLMDNDAAGYKLAMAMRREKKDPEECESVLDEEDKNGGSAGKTERGGEASAVSALEAASGGGETSAAAE